MSTGTQTAVGQGRPRRFRAVQPGVAIWLTVLWLLLWGDLTPLLVLGGVLVAVLVCVVFPLPALRMHLRLRPVAMAWLVIRFAYDVLVASWQVSKVVLRRRQVSNAIVEIQLRTPSDFVLTVVGEMLTLVPGSVLIEARRATHTIFMHVFDVDDEEQARAFRETALEQEKRVVRTFGINLEHLDLPPEQAQEKARATAPMTAAEKAAGLVPGMVPDRSGPPRRDDEDDEDDTEEFA